MCYMIEVFKTNVQTQEQANIMLSALLKSLPTYNIHFNVEDGVKVLSVEGMQIDPEKIIQIFVQNDFRCEVLYMIEVFRTNVQTQEWADMMLDKLSKRFPSCDINFDLDDCDKILRVEGIQIYPEKIIQIFAQNNFDCQILP